MVAAKPNASDDELVPRYRALTCSRTKPKTRLSNVITVITLAERSRELRTSWRWSAGSVTGALGLLPEGVEGLE